MNCPKCIYDDHWSKVDGNPIPILIEMEDKGEIVRNIKMEGLYLVWDKYHLYQCPVSKNIEIN